MKLSDEQILEWFDKYGSNLDCERNKYGYQDGYSGRISIYDLGHRVQKDFSDYWSTPKALKYCDLVDTDTVVEALTEYRIKSLDMEHRLSEEFRKLESFKEYTIKRIRDAMLNNYKISEEDMFKQLMIQELSSDEIL